MRASNEVSAKQLAESLNVSQAAITKAINSGRLRESIISKGKDGYTIDIKKALCEWENNRQRKTPSKLSIDELEANTSHIGDYPTQQESVQRKENALAEIAAIKYKDMIKDRYEFQKIEEIILQNVPESQKIEARRVINEFRELIKKKYR
jgi:biotin operon repressor